MPRPVWLCGPPAEFFAPWQRLATAGHDLDAHRLVNRLLLPARRGAQHTDDITLLLRATGTPDVRRPPGAGSRTGRAPRPEAHP